MKNYIGIDNGVTGSIGIINSDGAIFERMPVRSQQDYTKAKKNITRIDYNKLTAYFVYAGIQNSIAVIERPMVNPKRFKATISAVRALEAVLLCLEDAGVPHRFIDSKEWQRELLPKGLDGSAEKKKAAVDIANRLFPHIDFEKDADGMLIAEYARRKNF